MLNITEKDINIIKENKGNISIVCRNSRDDSAFALIDVFPHRIQPHEGITYTDVLLDLVANLDINYSYSADVSAEDDFRKGHLAYAKPDIGPNRRFFTAHAGGVHIISGGRYYIQKEDSDITIYYDEDKVTFPDGTCVDIKNLKSAVKFNPSSYKNMYYVLTDHEKWENLKSYEKFQHIVDSMEWQKRILFIIMIGGLTYYEGKDFNNQHSEFKKYLHGTAAAVNVLIEGSNAGRQGLWQGEEKVKDNIIAIFDNWLLGPNRGYMPQKWALHKDILEFIKTADSELIKIGFEVTKILYENKISIGHLVSEKKGCSAHEMISFKKIKNKINQNILENIDPDLLKPRAKNKALKIQENI